MRLVERRSWEAASLAKVDENDTPIFYSMFDEEFEHEEEQLPK